MNYRHIYCKIISYAKSQNRFKGDGNYYESHHILPKSLFPLWKNRKSNQVLLTAREHFFVHQLLAKIYPTQQMIFAMYAFIARPNADYKISSREYERIRTERSKLLSEKMMGVGIPLSKAQRAQINQKNTGQKRTKEQRRSMSEAQKRYFIENGHGAKYGYKCTEEQCLSIGFAQTKRNAQRYGLSVNEYKIRKKNKTLPKGGRHWYTNGVISIFSEKAPEGFKEGRLYKRKNTN